MFDIRYKLTFLFLEQPSNIVVNQQVWKNQIKPLKI